MDNSVVEFCDELTVHLSWRTHFDYMTVGVPRETEKEKEFADFDIFDDPESPFSTFNFQYSNEAYTRLHALMEFNTLNNLEVSLIYTGL